MSSPYFLLWNKPNGQPMTSDERMAVFTLAEKRGVRKTGDFNNFVAEVYRAKIDSLREEENFYTDRMSRERIRTERDQFEKDLKAFEAETGVAPRIAPKAPTEISNVPPTST